MQNPWFDDTAFDLLGGSGLHVTFDSVNFQVRAQLPPWLDDAGARSSSSASDGRQVNKAPKMIIDAPLSNHQTTHQPSSRYESTLLQRPQREGQRRRDMLERKRTQRAREAQAQRRRVGIATARHT